MSREVATVQVPGPPIPKGRARHGANGNVYTPEQTKDYEEKVGWCGRQAMKGRPPVKGWLKVTIDLYGDVGRADPDNYAKSCLDGLNKIVYKDDKQVDVLIITRHRDTPDPRAVIVITEL